MLQQPEKKHANCRPWILLSTFAFLIVVAGTHHFWPAIKGVSETARATVVPSENVSLTGIFYTEKDPLALVNGEMVYEQDVIDGVKCFGFEISAKKYGDNPDTAGAEIEN